MNIPIREPVYIIIPVHNRKNITLKCLETLTQNGDLQGYYIVVVDDSSTDGTAEAIYSLYPDVIVLKGDGNLWWTGAIKKGMEYAYEQGAKLFIWLNDDTLPSSGCISYMVSACLQNDNLIVTAQCYEDSDFKIPTYGGQKKKRLSLQPLYAEPTEMIECDCMNGNLVCLPSSVVDKIGLPLPEKFPHAMADAVYTWTAKKAGYDLEILGNAMAVCKFNPLEQDWLSGDIPMRERWKIINSPKSNLYPPAYWNFCQVFYDKIGIIPFLKLYIKLIFFTILRWIFPLSTLRKLKEIKDEFRLSSKAKT